MMMQSREAVVNDMTPRGLTHLMRELASVQTVWQALVSHYDLGGRSGRRDAGLLDGRQRLASVRGRRAEISGRVAAAASSPRCCRGDIAVTPR